MAHRDGKNSADITTGNTLMKKPSIYDCLGLGHFCVDFYLELIERYSPVQYKRSISKVFRAVETDFSTRKRKEIFI